ncbi:24248_t:CDS:1, partial [Gigaspora margarita]
MLNITEQSNTTEMLNVFIEDAVDALAILLQKLILSAEIESVLEVQELPGINV